MFRTTGARLAVLAATVVVLTSCTTFPSPGPPASGDGCAVPATAVSDRPASLRVGNTVRNYTWSASARPGPKPLVIDIHGLLEGLIAGVHPDMSQYTPKAHEEGFVVAYPIGENGGVNWELGEHTPSLRFIDELLVQLREDVCIDPARIYVTGLSYGATMTTQLMCYRSEVFAAAAPVAGLLRPDNAGVTNPGNCNPTRRIPVVTFHGESDPILAFDYFAPSPQAWATRYGCGPKTTTVEVTSDPVTRRPIYKDTWACEGTAVESWRVEGGGHAWPGSAFSTAIAGIVGLTATSIDATDISWEFFERFSLPAS